ncbi:MAG: hypothetical protein JXD22_08115 [Sedimentisphaerales bacterium]|nr:hypothetical protein [Sedimentisphaerales bacterium]
MLSRCKKLLKISVNPSIIFFASFLLRPAASTAGGALALPAATMRQHGERALPSKFFSATSCRDLLRLAKHGERACPGGCAFA